MAASIVANITVRYAASDDDTIAIHKFLCVVAGPTLPGPIDAVLSINEVWRVVQHEVALMAIAEDRLVGTLGLSTMTHWWGPVPFWGNRWFFTLPGLRAGKPLLDEAKEIGIGTSMEVIIISEARGKISILNKSSNRVSNPNVLRESNDLDRERSTERGVVGHDEPDESGHDATGGDEQPDDGGRPVVAERGAD